MDPDQMASSYLDLYCFPNGYYSKSGFSRTMAGVSFAWRCFCVM